MRGPRRLGALAAALAFGATLATAAGPQVAAHRGGALLWPENSLLAFRNALALGVDYLETDIHLTADGEVVVMHDPTLERTSTGRGAIRDARLAELGAVRLKAADGSVTAERVPTLAALLDVLVGSPTARLLLEIKVGPGRQPYAGIEEKALAIVKARGLLERVVVMAFEDATLVRVRAVEPAARRLLLVSRNRAASRSARDIVQLVTAAGAAELGIDHNALTADVVAAAHAAGLRVAAWTVNDEPDMRRVISLGVDVVISDRPDLVRRVK